MRAASIPPHATPGVHNGAPPCLAVAHRALFESWWPYWLAGQWPRSSAEELQGSVAGLEARNAQLVREVAELKSRLATAGSPNPTMRGSSSNERTKTTTRERADAKTGVPWGRNPKVRPRRGPTGADRAGDAGVSSPAAESACSNLIHLFFAFVISWQLAL